MKIASLLIAAATLASCACLGAGDVQGRIDVDGRAKGITLASPKGEGGNVMNATWDKDAVKGKQVVVGMFAAGPEWRKCVMSFVPDKDGELVLGVKGAWNKDNSQTWTLIDAVQVDGAELKNGNFEEGQANWTFGGPEGSKAQLVDNAKSGSKAVKVCYASPAVQNIQVKAGEPVSISFWCKSAE